MKKILLVILIAVSIMGNSSCNKSFLQSESQDGSLTEDLAFRDEEAYQSFLLGAYSELQGNADERGALQWLLIPGMVSQDVVPVDEIPNALSSYVTPGAAAFIDYWTSFYKVVGRTNLLLEKLAVAPDFIDDDAIAKMEGQAKFLRGFAYFNLARAFGNVPMPLASFQDDQKTLACTDEALVWTQVVADLKDASMQLPTRTEWGGENLGRASKGAALTYLANAYLYQKDWVNAKKASEELIGLEEYRLLDDVRDVFSSIHENTDESIFEVQYRDLDNGEILWSGQPEQGTVASEWTAPLNIGEDNAPFGGWGEAILNRKLADSYEPGDDRRKKLIVIPGETYQGELMTSPLIIPEDVPQNHSAFSTKYWLGPTDLAFSGQNLPQMRYAEFLLNYAEILFQSGQPQQAYDQINLVRSRAKLGDKPVSNDAEQFLTDLMNERRWELNFEPNLWFHYTRLDRAGKFLQEEHGVAFNQAWNKFPIPQGDRDLNPQLCQNSGY